MCWDFIVIFFGSSAFLESCKKVRCLNGKRCLEDQNGLPHCVHCQVHCQNSDDDRVLCGEDGVTYRNPCELRAAVCRRHKSIRIAYYGKCRGTNYQNSSFITILYRCTCLVMVYICNWFVLNKIQAANFYDKSYKTWLISLLVRRFLHNKYHSFENMLTALQQVEFFFLQLTLPV